MTGEGPASRRRRLQAVTREVHDDLDRRIMQAEPFANRDRYAGFLAMQYRLHAASAVFYADPALAALIPDLPGRGRVAAFARDLGDLGRAVPADVPPPPATDPAFGLGWIYVIEGSTLGAAFLFKAAAGLGVDADHGACGLSAPDGGRAEAWRRFVAGLDAVPLAPADEARVDDGARAAFALAGALAADL